MKIEFTKYTHVVSPLHNEQGLSINLRWVRETERRLGYALATQRPLFQIEETRSLERGGIRMPEEIE